MISSIQFILIAIASVMVYFIVRKVYLIRMNATATIGKPSTKIEPKEYVILTLLTLFLLLISLKATFNL
ncbi:hypothetical protein [Ekhidna sp.]|uniref:hypothetical protein n=1 Tax=Ekhidna sp. TaxID=2608089 RepID=UPI003B501750